MACAHRPLQIYGSVRQPVGVSSRFDQLKASLSSTFKPLFSELHELPMKIDVSKTMKNASRRVLDVFVDSMFKFVDQPLIPSQSNFAPVEEIGEAVEVTCTYGEIPVGSNPRFGGLKSAVSAFGESSHVWVEGEGMLHALYFSKNDCGGWTLSYKNKYVQSETFKLETESKRPIFLPTVEGDSLAVLAAILLNKLRFDNYAKLYQNVNVIECSGRFFTTNDNSAPQEIDIFTLQSLELWDIGGAWTRPFTSHPKAEVINNRCLVHHTESSLFGRDSYVGVVAEKPYWMVGVVSADGKKLLHEVDLKYDRSRFNHEIGVTPKYNVIIDCPLTVDRTRLLYGGQLIKYEEEEVARIGVMPRYGDADSVKWFVVQPNCTFHIINCFEEGDEVVARGCRASTSIIPGPDWGVDKFEWFSRGFQFTKPVDEGNADDGFSGSSEYGYLFHRPHEWRLNMVTGEVKEKHLTGTEYSMDFPFINETVHGFKHNFAYTQVIDSLASSNSGMSKYGGLAKLHLNGQQSTLPMKEENDEQPIRTEYHKYGENVFGTGAVFVPKQGGVGEDEGWIITFVHNEETNVSQAHIIDAKKFEGEPTAVISLPHRVPYGFHGTFAAMPDLAKNISRGRIIGRSEIYGRHATF